MRRGPDHPLASRRREKGANMTWVKLDDKFYAHPRAVAAGRDGRAASLAALCWPKAHLTDGIIPNAMLAQLAIHALDRTTGGAKAASALVRVGLWHDEGEHWRIHDYHQRNDSAADEKARRDQIASERSRAGRVGGVRSGEARRGEATKQNRSKTEANTTRAYEANVKPDTDTNTNTEKEGVKTSTTTRSLAVDAANDGGGGGRVISITDIVRGFGIGDTA
jgi:hypothetical protein